MLNFENVCRTCSLQGELQSLFVEELLNPAEMLTEIVNTKVIKGDKYPQNICMRCLDALKAAYLFKNQCQEVYKKFEQYLSLSSEIIVDCKQELFDNAFIKEEKQSDFSDNNEDWSIETSNSTYQKPYQCEKCSIQLKNQKTYKRHLKKHEQLYMCPICREEFINKNNFEQHNCKHNYEDGKLILKNNEVKLEDTAEKIYGSHETTKQSLLKDKITQKKKLLCDYCGREYSEAAKLNIHIRIHTGEKPLSCNECNQFFSSHSLLSQHRQIHHSSEKQFKCEVCGKCFALPRWLKIHLMIHTNDKPFTCDICNQKFRQRHHLSRHKFVHTGEKPFVCSICNKQFTQNSNLRTHMRTHTGEKPYVCSTCGKGFHDSSSLKNHRKKHVLFIKESNQNVPSVSNTKK